jgi:ribokinase
MILVFGSINVDLVTQVDAIAKPGETVLASSYSQTYGGKGANQAVAAARTSLPDTRVAMVGSVGGDALGDACLENLRSVGIDTNGISIVDATTGCAFISVDRHGENAITVASGANLGLRHTSVDESMLFASGIAVLQMEIPAEENLALARRVRQRGVPVVLNFAPANANVTKETLCLLLQEIDYLVVNEHEAVALAANLSNDDSSRALREAASFIVDAANAVLIVTLGSEGVMLFDANGETWRCPALRIDAVDTTGAGDTFVGAFAAKLNEAADLRSAVRFANAAAALACTASGAQPAIPGRDDVLRAMVEN